MVDAVFYFQLHYMLILNDAHQKHGGSPEHNEDLESSRQLKVYI